MMKKLLICRFVHWQIKIACVFFGEKFLISKKRLYICPLKVSSNFILRTISKTIEKTMKKIVTMQLLPLWLLAIFLFASKPVGAQSYTYSEATPKVGIIKQIGCGTGNKADKAQIQVIHDGVGYSYNFGANATDISNNTAWVPAGARTIVVSKGGTTYNLPITVPAKVTPSFTPVITYNCNGTADVRLTNNQGTYNYTYTYGGSTHNSPYFRGLAVGQHTITVKYTATTTTRDIVFYDDFGVKPTGGDKAVRSKYAISTMNFAPLNGTQVQPDGTIIVGQRLTNDACYTVATKADADTEGSTGVWLYPNDKDGNANGRYLYYDAGTINQNLYTRKAKVTPNTPVNFSAYLFNAVHTTYSASNKVKVSLDIYANETDAENHTNALFVSYPYNVPAADPSDPNKWHPINVTANIGGGYSELVFVVRMYGSSDGGAGNDIALDNILVTQPTTTCEQTVAVPVNITGNAYSTTVTYNCAANDATVVVTPSVTTGYTYTYKLDNGVAGSVNTFNNVAVGVHTLTVTSRYTGATVKEIFKEDFGSGAPYSLPETVVPKDFVCKDVLYGFPADILPEGHYQVANRENLTKNTLWSWVNPKDHTNSGDSKGRYLAFNYGANGGKVFYQQDIKVEANKPVTVEYYLYSLNSGNVAQKPIIKAVLVNKTTGTAVHTSSQYYLAGSTNDTDWKKISFTFTPNVSDLQLRLINDNNDINANDFAIDDILITQGAYDTCTSTITATVSSGVTRVFAGVTKLIGCGTGLNANKAEVQVTNIEGGTAPYEYQFGTGASWVASNTGWLDAGTHTVSVRNAGSIGCVYSMSVTVPTALAAPVIKTEVFYGCDGKPTLQVGVQSPVNELTYLYKLDNGAFTTTSVFANVSSGTHQVSVKYEHRDTPSPMVLWREDFGTGDPAPNPSVTSAFTFLDGRYNFVSDSQYTVAAYKDLVAPNQFGATRASLTYPAVPTGIWQEVFKGTTTGENDDRYLYVDMSNSTYNLVFMEKEVTIDPNNLIEFSYQIRSYNGPSATPPLVNPNMQIKIVDANNNSNVLAAINSGAIPHDGQWHLVSSRDLGAINPNGVSRVKIQFINKESSTWGNDFALDDITVYQTPATCGQVVSITQNITDNPVGVATFTAAQLGCGTTNGTVVVTASPTIGYIYTYTLHGGTATSVNTFANLSFGTHTFTINYAPVTNTLVLLNEDFGEGTDAVKSPYVGKNLYFNENTLSAYTAYNGNKQSINHLANTALMAGEYTIANNMVKLSYDWTVPTDRSGKANGRKLFIDGIVSVPEQEIYTREVSIAPNLPLTFTTDFYNLVHNTTVPSANNPKVNIALYESEASYKNGSVPLAQSAIEELLSVGNQWKTHTLTLTAADVGARTRIYAVVKMHNVINSGHDLTIDNIRITQSIGCEATVTATVLPGVTRAFAGVTKLIGCGTGANANNAEVTIANVEGGSGTYEYQFDGLTWTTTNTGWLPAGTHTVSVRNAGSIGCVYSMSVNVPAALAAPVIKTEVFYACDGKAILNIGVENPDPALKYLYSLDGAAYTTTYLYTNVASGTHSVSVQYEYANAPSPVMLLKETFGRPTSAHQLPAGTTDVPYGVNMGHYQISNPTLSAAWGNIPATDGCSESKIWVKALDHTSNGTDMQGGFYIVDANPSMLNGELYYKKKVTNIAPYSDIKYEFYVLNLFREDKKINGGIDALKPKLEVRLVNNSNQVIGTPLKTGELPNSTCGTGMSNWRKIEGVLNVGNNTEFTIEFRSDGGAPHGWGNDFVLDDITVYQVPKACGQVVSTTKVVTANNQDIPAFTVSKTYDCATGKGALTVTPTATTGFTYTYTLGSTTYTSTTATFTGLDLEQTYTVTVNYQAVSNTVTLLNEDFGVGTTATDAVKSPYIGEDWYFNKNTTESYSTSNGKGQSKVHPANKYLDNQEYTIAPEFILNSNSNDWMKPVDKSGNANGRKLFVDGHATLTTEANLYLREIGVLPNQPLTFTTDFFNVISLAKTAAANNPIVQPQVRLQLYESEKAFKDGNAPLKQTNIYHVPAGSTATVADWKTQTLTLSSTEVGNRTKLFAVIKMYNLQHSGHDLAVDNIVITQKLSACATTVTATLTKGDVATPTLTLPANLTVVCSAPTASATISSWIASAVATSTCGTATVTHNYVAPANLCNVSGNAVSVTFTTTDAFGNVTTGTRVITFGTMTLTVTPTALSVPNGATGGTTSSVVPNITLGGVASPSTNSVTITFSGLPTGVTTNTNGQLVIPAGTPAGTHTITYRVCETAGHNNCKTVNTILVIGAATPTVSTETFTASTTTATVVPGVIGNILTNATVGTQSATVGVGGNVTITLTHTPTTPNAPVLDPSTGNVTVGGNTPPGVYTITYNLCSAVSTCVPGVATVTVPQLKPYVPNTTITHSGTTTTTRNILDGATVNGGTQSATVGVGGTVSITNVTNPTPQTPGAPVPTLNPSTGIVTVPPTTPSGVYTISYTVCTTATPTNCTTGVTTVVVGNVTPTVVPDGFTASTTTATVVPGVIGNVLTNDRVGTQSATVGVGGNVTINVTHTPTTPNAPVLDPSTGNVTVGGNTPAGVYTISYQVCSGAACTPATVTVTVPQLKPYVPNTTITHSGTTTTTRNILDGATVNGGTQSATVGVGGTVSITNVTNPTPQTPGAPVPTLNPSTGIVTVPPTTPSGVYTISYTVCTTATPTNCTTGVTTVVVGNVTPTVVPSATNVTAHTRVNTPVNIGVTSSTTVMVSIPSQPANGTAVDNGDGTITYTPNNGFKGIDSFEYRLCNASGCHTATISVRVTNELVIYTGVSVGGDKNNHFHIEGIENYPNNIVRIYNRWGVKVFEVSGYNNTTKVFKGVSDARATLEASDNLPQGTYYYIIEYHDEANKKQTEVGWLYLKKN